MRLEAGKFEQNAVLPVMKIEVYKPWIKIANKHNKCARLSKAKGVFKAGGRGKCPVG